VFLLGATLSLLEIRMAQLLLPIFPDAVTPVKELLSVEPLAKLTLQG
jgi:hypothetical protein